LLYRLMVGLWSYGQGQQPFGGVGRLYLSSRGSREPRLGKCNDLRLFLYLYKIGTNPCTARKDSGNFIEGEMRRCPCDLFNEKMSFCKRKAHRAETRAAWCETECGIYSRGII